MKYLLPLCLILLFSCKSKERPNQVNWTTGDILDVTIRNTRYPIRLVVDMKKFFTRMGNDSIWWSHGEYVSDHIDSSGSFKISSGHELPQDTIYGIKHWPTTVVIIDKDTQYHYGGDTVRIKQCNPQTTNINKANDVYIN